MIESADEFDTIRRLFRPLAHPTFARGLMDDVAAVPSRPGFDLIATKDAIVERVHFLADDPLDTVARKLLRVNLSDMAAKGAEGFGYLIACHWSDRCGWAERERFAAGLAEDQARYGVHLLGGDTVSTPGPASFSMTLLGWAPKDRAVARAGAKPGDLVMVTGEIGDGSLGLRAAQGGLGAKAERVEVLAARYRIPQPPVIFAPVILAHAAAALDISDGLVADLGHMAEASGARVIVDLERLPLSLAATAWIEQRVDPLAALVELATGGDDYEIAFAIRPNAEEAVRREAERLHVRVTAIGEVGRGRGIVVRHEGAVVPIESAGWRHE